MLIILMIIYFIFIGCALFTIFFPEYYFSELALSFLPYSIVISLLGLLIGIVLFVRSSKKNFGKLPKIRLFFALVIILSATVFSIYSRKFTYFYNVSVPQISNNMTGGLKVLYANIYKNNTNYLGIEDRIKKENPDILFFVEFADHHYDYLKDFLKKNYPYSNSTRWTKKYVGNMVFSKVKIENRADDFPQGAWRYAYFSVEYKKEPVYFYLVHMSSPVSLKFFYMRNEQINTFFKDFFNHQENHRIKHDKVVAMGDFNTSPWSEFYWSFAQGFEGEFINITRSLPIVFSWKSLGIPFLRTHIDHIFVNKFVFIENLEVIDIPGSDHRGFTFFVR